MKKLLLGLLLLLAFTNLDAQQLNGVAEPIVTYRIDTTSHSNGLQVPSGWYLSISKLEAVPDTSGSLILNSLSISSTDSNMVHVFNCDSINSYASYQMTIEHVETLTLGGMIEEYIKKSLEQMFGTNNVVKFK